MGESMESNRSIRFLERPDLGMARECDDEKSFYRITNT